MCSYLFLILPPLFHSFFIICPKKQKNKRNIKVFFFRKLEGNLLHNELTKLWQDTDNSIGFAGQTTTVFV